MANKFSLYAFMKQIYGRHFTSTIVILSIVVFIQSVLEFLLVYYSGKIIDLSEIGASFDYVLRVVVMLIFFLIGSIVLSVAVMCFGGKMTIELTQKLQNKLIDNLCRSEYAALEKINSHELLSRVGGDAADRPLDQQASLFSIVRGEIVALVGASGSGKSTIVKALLQLIDYSGKILLTGVDAHAGPDGSNLSGGQGQRVAIARAFIRESPFLILDEPTSSLDAVSEEKVLSSIRLLKNRGCGILLITHRESTMQIADRIMVLENKTLVDGVKREEALQIIQSHKGQ